MEILMKFTFLSVICMHYQPKKVLSMFTKESLTYTDVGIDSIRPAKHVDQTVGSS